MPMFQVYFALLWDTCNSNNSWTKDSTSHPFISAHVLMNRIRDCISLPFNPFVPLVEKGGIVWIRVPEGSLSCCCTKAWSSLQLASRYFCWRIISDWTSWASKLIFIVLARSLSFSAVVVTGGTLLGSSICNVLESSSGVGLLEDIDGYSKLLVQRGVMHVWLLSFLATCMRSVIFNWALSSTIA